MSREQKRLYDRGEFSSYYLAETYALLGNRTEAVQYLNLAFERREDGVVGVEGHPLFNSLHDEPGFRQLLDKIGLPALP